MYFREVLLLPILISCSLFGDDSSTEKELNLELISGKWYKINTLGETKFLKLEDVDTTRFDFIMSFSLGENNNCGMVRIKPAYNRYSNCEYRIYGNKPDVILQINYIEMFQQRPLDEGQLYRINDISESFIKVT